MKQSALIIIFAILAISPVNAQKTTRKNLSPKQAEVTAPASEAVLDTLVAPEQSDITVSGYDKPLRSRRETFFTTNNTDREIERIAFTIVYLDSKQRMLHKVSQNLPVNIPASETRQVVFKSWDPQFNFYYLRSAVPQRVEQATPYDIRLSVDTIFLRTL